MRKRNTSRERAPKLCGADIELGNFVLGTEGGGRSGREASHALLAEIDGLAVGSAWRPPAECAGRIGIDLGTTIAGYNPQDWGRKFLASNGGCAYIDLDHLELCLPEVRSAYDHVACWHAMLRIARAALDAANERRTAGRRIQVLVNNSDGQGNSYGSHLNFLLTRRAWDRIFQRKLHQLLYLAAYQASSIIFTGQGKVGSENDAPEAHYQISQRADFYETLLGPQTTYNRPVVNSRDEPLCGAGRRRDGGFARLHVIFFDNTLCHAASLLKVGATQIVLAMLEAEDGEPDLILDDAVEAVQAWSRDPRLQTRARTCSGKHVTAIEAQAIIVERARRFVDRGGCDGAVPRAREIVALWEDTLDKLERRDFAALARRLDWVLKLWIIERAREQRPQLRWNSPELKHLDHLYSSLDAAEGLYWTYERAGAVEKLVPDSAIERFVSEPPEDTRAWARATLLRHIPEGRVEDVDWDGIRFRPKSASRYWTPPRTLRLEDPLDPHREEIEEALGREGGLERLAELLDPSPDGARIVTFKSTLALEAPRA